MKMKNNEATRFSLFPNEEVIRTTRLHWINLVMPSAVAVAAFVALWWRCMNIDLSLAGLVLNKTILPAEYQLDASLAGAAVLLYLHIRSLVSIIGSMLTRYYITDRRVIVTSGILTVTMSEMLLDRCETVTLSQNLLERMLDSGDIMILSAGATLMMNDVPNVNSFRMTILEQSSKKKSNNI